jgi:hypothetical protein
MNNFYVYVHRRLSDNRPFYVGKGKGNRAYKKSGRNLRWLRTVNKHGYTVEIVFDSLEETEAFQCEKDTIMEFKYFGYDLCNMTDGGEGASGAIVSAETRAKISAAHLGKPKTPEAIEKTRLGSLGIKRTPEHNLKNSLARMGNKQKEDKLHYIFYSDNDIYFGKRRDLETYANLQTYAINNLFTNGKRKYKSVHGWSLLTSTQLILINNLLRN